MTKTITWDDIRVEISFCIEQVKNENFEAVDELEARVEKYFNNSVPTEDQILELKSLIEELKSQINLKIMNYSNELEEHNRNNENIHKYISAKKLGIQNND